MRIRKLPLSTLVVLSMALGACAGPLAPTADPSVAPITIDGYVEPDLLVNPAWIQEQAGGADVRLVDVSGNADDCAGSDFRNQGGSW